jgi:hypothetical protein
LFVILEPAKYFQFESEKGGLDYRITSLGHPISLKTEYPKSLLGKYEIKLQKGRDRVMKSTYHLAVGVLTLQRGALIQVTRRRENQTRRQAA